MLSPRFWLEADLLLPEHRLERSHHVSTEDVVDLIPPEATPCGSTAETSPVLEGSLGDRLAARLHDLVDWFPGSISRLLRHGDLRVLPRDASQVRDDLLAASFDTETEIGFR